MGTLLSKFQRTGRREQNQQPRQEITGGTTFYSNKAEAEAKMRETFDRIKAADTMEKLAALDKKLKEERQSHTQSTTRSTNQSYTRG